MAEDLQQLLLIPLPNVAVLGREPLTEAAVDEMKKLLLLLLGCAVQCERKEEFIEQIQMLDIETQTDIATYIQEITLDQHKVLSLQLCDPSELSRAAVQNLFQNLTLQLQSLVRERDAQLERISELMQDNRTLQTQHGTPSPLTPLEAPPVQLADSKARLRAREELEESSEQLLDCKQEVQDLEAELKKLRQENRDLLSEARLARQYRDELDCVRERASRAERLQSEVAGYRERLQGMELYRGKLEEERAYSGPAPGEGSPGGAAGCSEEPRRSLNTGWQRPRPPGEEPERRRGLREPRSPSVSRSVISSPVIGCWERSRRTWSCAGG
ncbi:protein Daple-like [Acipenser oxyrinchus oxyrinchus]|uniref:Protein Daple-like n=1 Tax=Acipenser oxyrinchus oxyrinchus TaxID=40147 RepID=A0AAD8FRV9_ACIOX|nr:protein Daple-like [Acipenser oxyrinchus oxyrinchus]